MNALLQRAGDWWSSREPRERVLLGVLAALLVGLGYWYGAVQPLRAWADAEVERHAGAAAALGQARALDAAARAQQARGQGPVQAALLQRTAEAAGVSIGPVEPAGSGDVGVSIEAAGVKPLFAWISALQRDESVGVRRLEVHQGDDGLLQVSVVFAGRPQ